MKLHLPKINAKQGIVLGILLLAVVLVTGAIADKYHAYRVERIRKAEAVQVEQNQINAATTQKEADRQASINRLVSICMNDQQAFDKLAAKDKVGKLRPDCTVVE